MSIDPITIEVVASRLREIAAGMEHALYHAGFSPILRESRDGTAGLTDAQGRVLMVGGGLQYHSLPYEQAVRAVMAEFGDRMRYGDTFIVNDPYVAGNPHVPDMVAVTPAFHDGVLIGFTVSIAHKADMGGLVPGSSGAGSREIFHDGLRLPPVRYRSLMGIQSDIEEVLRANSRTPEVVIGDLRGQVGATRLGAVRLLALVDEYGGACVLGVMDEILERTARRLGAELAAWPDGEAEAEGFLDNDGAELDKPVRIAVRAKKRGDRLTLDLSGSAPQTRGPVNVNAWTARSVSLLAVLAASDPTIPLNSGLLRAVDFVIPEGLVVNPHYPATINLYFPTSVLIFTCVLSALGKLNPARAVAPSGLVTGAVSLGYHNRAKPLVQYELGATGLGGTSQHDGTPIVHPMNHFTAGSPIEVVESEYPVLMRRYDIWTDSAGAGHTRGGIGYVRELEVQEDCLLTLRSSGHRSAAWGLAGGEGPAASRTTVNPGTPGEQRLAAIDTRELKAGDVLRIERSGGAGCGPPRERDADAVRRDMADGYVSREAARERYGVVIEPGTIELD